jgi:hypothetical protein
MHVWCGCRNFGNGGVSTSAVAVDLTQPDVETTQLHLMVDAAQSEKARRAVRKSPTNVAGEVHAGGVGSRSECRHFDGGDSGHIDVCS